MPDLGAFGPSVLILLVLIVMLWFTFGTQRNIRKGNDLLRWLQTGLPLLGRKTSLRWLGSSAVELDIADGSAPFRDATVVVVLEPRDVGLLWAFARARGRRDFLIVRANLRRPPTYSLRVGDPVAWTGTVDPTAEDDGWHRIPWSKEVLVAYASEGADPSSAAATWDRLDEVTGGVWRLTIQPVVPHLEVHVRPPALDQVPAEQVIRAIRDLWAQLAGDGRA
jgi:hypothetical protein